MKRFIIGLLLALFLLPACKEESSTPTTNPEFSEGIGEYDISGLWQGYSSKGNTSESPEEMYFLSLRDVSESEYTVTSGFGGQDTLFWKTFTVSKSEEEIEINLTDSTSHIRHEIVIEGVKDDSDGKFIAALVTTFENYTNRKSSEKIIFEYNREPGMIDYLGLFGRPKNIAGNTTILEYKFGTGQPIVLLHGFLGQAKTWDEMLDSLEANNFGEKYSVYTYEYDYDLPIAEIVAEMQTNFNSEFKDTAPTIVGHSMGGFVTRAYILNGGNFKDFISLGAPLGGVYLNDAPINKFLLSMLFTAGTMDMVLGADYLENLNQIDESEVDDRYYLFSSRLSGSWEHTLEESIPYWDWLHDYSGEAALLNIALKNVMDGKNLPNGNDGFISNYSSNMLWKYDESQINTPGFPKMIDIGMTAAHISMSKPHLCPEFYQWLLNDYK